MKGWVLFWCLAFVGFLILEAVTVALTSLWFAAGSLAALLCAWLHGPAWLQILWFLLITAAALFLCRPLAVRYVNSRGQPTNADRYLNMRGVVTETIDNAASRGSVKVEGRLWTARSVDGSIIPRGSIVEAREIRGVKLMVEEVRQGSQNITGR